MDKHEKLKLSYNGGLAEMTNTDGRFVRRNDELSVAKQSGFLDKHCGIFSLSLCVRNTDFPAC